MTEQIPTSPTGSSHGPHRLIGLDIARGFAVIGMVLVNFKIAMGAEDTGPAWLRSLSSLLDGRAAATFVVLAGIGASLGSRRARESADASAERDARRVLRRRAVFLFVIGWAFFAIWPADILHYYGVYLAIGSVLLFADSRVLTLLAGASVAASLAFIVLGDPFANWNADLSYRGLLTPMGFLRNLLVDGFHPVLPWISFYLVGMCIGRLGLRDRALRRRMAVGAAVAVVAAEATAWLAVGPKGTGYVDVDPDSWWRFLAAQPVPPLPLFVVAGVSTAVLVILGSIWVGEHISAAAVEPLVSTGQLALTIYLAHVLVGMIALDAFGRLNDQSLQWATLTALLFCSVAVGAAMWWRRRFERGPLEWVMRRVAG